MSLSDSGINIVSQIDLPTTYAITAFLSIALYNVIELTVFLFVVFKRHGGLYFWTFLLATWGIAFYAIGFIPNDFKLAQSIRLFNVTLIVMGWCTMITGQSLVLYSRLHLIVQQRYVLRLVLGMIITNAILLQIPIIILCYGANSVLYQRFSTLYAVYERIQVTVFFLQESIISSIYMYEMCRLFHISGTIQGQLPSEEAGKRLMLHLIYVNIVVILLDVAILVLQYSGRYSSQTAAKGFIYSVKLKIEFKILNRLVELAHTSRHQPWGSSGDQEDGFPSSSVFVEQRLQPEQGRGQDSAARRQRRTYSCPWYFFTIRVKEMVIGSYPQR
ncbi:hypothetical protein BJX62DRAFT_250234 [Aspergillus germanicus]